MPQSSRLPKRPVRLTSQESLAANKQPELAGDAASASTSERDPAHTEKAGPAPVEEISTMVLPGWREELEHLRKNQAVTNASSAPVAPDKQPDPPPSQKVSPAPRRIESSAALPPSQELPSPSRRAESSAAPSPRESAGSPKIPQRNAFSARGQRDTPLPENRSHVEVDQIRRELHVKVWEQEPTIQYPQVHPETKEAGPAPAVEHTPFASVAFGQEEEVEQIANQATINWRTPADPSPISRPVEHEPAIEQRPARVVEEPEKVEEAEEEEDSSDVEDLPTVPLAVPEAVKRQSAITIERASTPAPVKRSAPSAEEVEDLPTMPLAASPAGPRSPLPPVAPQPAQRRAQEQRETRPAPISRVPNPPSMPGAYGSAPASQPMNAAPEVAFGPTAGRGPVANPPSQPGQTFNPAALPPLPQGPVSAPGIAPFRSEAPAPPQRPPSFAPPTPPPFTPRPDIALSSSAEDARKKKRMRPATIAVLILLVLAVGGGAFAIYYQSTSGVSQAYQSFQNSTLGVSLNYPQGWTASVNQARTSVHFADSSQTGQVTLSMAAANGQQQSQYLSQETTQLGITTPKAGPASTFAGSSWQQEQGNVVQKGATYMVVLYVTQHNGHFYMLAFMAPQPAYGQMEQENFAPLRASFRFL